MRDGTKGPRVAARLAFAATYVAVQGGLVLTAGSRPDHAFGFRMFSEASAVSVKLARELDAPEGGARLVPAEDGAWVARDAGGRPRRFAWGDRVRDPGLATLDVAMHASYGAGAQLARLKAALDDVATHTPEDTETRALLADVTVWHNGREPYVVHLRSIDRR